MKFWFSKTDTAAQEPAKKEAPAAAKPEVKPAPPPQPAAPVQTAPSPQPAPQPQAPAAQQPTPAPAAVPKPPAAQGASQRELYRNLMDALYDAVLLVDEKGYIVDSNMRVEHTFGYSKEDMWDMSLQKLIKGFGPMILTRIAEPLGENRPVIISGRGIRKDGVLFEAEISVSKVKLLRKETLLFTVRDVTRRLMAVQEKLERARQAKPAAPVRGVLRCARKVPSPK